MRKHDLTPEDAVIVVDVQNDFCPGGALPVPDGDRVVPVVNRWVEAALRGGATVVVSRDWHPADHVSFRERGGPWPAHCVQGTDGARFHPGLHVPTGALLVDKAAAPERECYSDFAESTLAADLRRRGVRRVWVGGLALDVCVRATVLDALREGFETHVIVSGTRAIDADGGRKALREMAAAGAVIESGESHD